VKDDVECTIPALATGSFTTLENSKTNTTSNAEEPFRRWAQRKMQINRYTPKFTQIQHQEVTDDANDENENENEDEDDS